MDHWGITEKRKIEAKSFQKRQEILREVLIKKNMRYLVSYLYKCQSKIKGSILFWLTFEVAMKMFRICELHAEPELISHFFVYDVTMNTVC